METGSRLCKWQRRSGHRLTTDPLWSPNVPTVRHRQIVCGTALVGRARERLNALELSLFVFVPARTACSVDHRSWCGCIYRPSCFHSSLICSVVINRGLLLPTPSMSSPSLPSLSSCYAPSFSLLDDKTLGAISVTCAARAGSAEGGVLQYLRFCSRSGDALYECLACSVLARKRIKDDVSPTCDFAGWFASVCAQGINHVKCHACGFVPDSALAAHCAAYCAAPSLRFPVVVRKCASARLPILQLDPPGLCLCGSNIGLRPSDFRYFYVRAR